MAHPSAHNTTLETNFAYLITMHTAQGSVLSRAQRFKLQALSCGNICRSAASEDVF